MKQLLRDAEQVHGFSVDIIIKEQLAAIAVGDQKDRTYWTRKHVTRN